MQSELTLSIFAVDPFFGSSDIIFNALVSHRLDQPCTAADKDSTCNSSDKEYISCAFVSDLVLHCCTEVSFEEVDLLSFLASLEHSTDSVSVQ